MLIVPYYLADHGGLSCSGELTKSHYFDNLFNKFKESASNEITIKIPNAQKLVILSKNYWEKIFILNLAKNTSNVMIFYH